MNAKLLPQHTPFTVPEPIDWQPPPSTWQRLRRAAAVPVTAAAAVFVAIVLISIFTVWTAPHTPSLASSGSGTSTASGTPDGALGGTRFADGAEVGGAGSAETTTGADGAENSDGQATAAFVVHVVGEVHSPGVYSVPQGSRVTDAIDAAGGATESAVLSSVNLARLVVDGEQIAVPNVERAPSGGGTGAGADGTGAGASGSAIDAVSGTVNLNTADLAALDTLPGVGPALAQRILDWRAANGGFTSVEQLLDVSGIGQKVLDRLQARVTV